MDKDIFQMIFISVVAAATDGLTVLFVSDTEARLEYVKKVVERTSEVYAAPLTKPCRSTFSFKDGGSICFKTLDEAERMKGHRFDKIVYDGCDLDKHPSLSAYKSEAQNVQRR